MPISFTPRRYRGIQYGQAVSGYRAGQARQRPATYYTRNEDEGPDARQREMVAKLSRLEQEVRVRDRNAAAKPRDSFGRTREEREAVLAEVFAAAGHGPPTARDLALAANMSNDEIVATVLPPEGEGAAVSVAPDAAVAPNVAPPTSAAPSGPVAEPTPLGAPVTEPTPPVTPPFTPPPVDPTAPPPYTPPEAGPTAVPPAYTSVVEPPPPAPPPIIDSSVFGAPSGGSVAVPGTTATVEGGPVNYTYAGPPTPPPPQPEFQVIQGGNVMIPPAEVPWKVPERIETAAAPTTLYADRFGNMVTMDQLMASYSAPPPVDSSVYGAPAAAPVAPVDSAGGAYIDPGATDFTYAGPPTPPAEPPPPPPAGYHYDAAGNLVADVAVDPNAAVLA